VDERNDLAEHLMADMPEAERQHFIEVIAENEAEFLRQNASDAVLPDQRQTGG
jgi:hypothetical protein